MKLKNTCKQPNHRLNREFLKLPLSQPEAGTGQKPMEVFDYMGYTDLLADQTVDLREERSQEESLGGMDLNS